MCQHCGKTSSSYCCLKTHIKIYHLCLYLWTDEFLRVVDHPGEVGFDGCLGPLEVTEPLALWAEVEGEGGVGGGGQPSRDGSPATGQGGGGQQGGAGHGHAGAKGGGRLRDESESGAYIEANTGTS